MKYQIAKNDSIKTHSRKEKNQAVVSHLTMNEWRGEHNSKNELVIMIILCL